MNVMKNLEILWELNTPLVDLFKPEAYLVRFVSIPCPVHQIDCDTFIDVVSFPFLVLLLARMMRNPSNLSRIYMLSSSIQCEFNSHSWNLREISIFDIEYVDLTSFDIKFEGLSKYDIERANSFETRDFGSFS